MQVSRRHHLFRIVSKLNQNHHNIAKPGSIRYQSSAANTNSNINRINNSDNSGQSIENVHQRIAGRQRFYKKVDVQPVVLEEGAVKHQIFLDGRKLRTPARNLMQFDSPLLASAIACEWDNQTCEKRGIQPATMPLMMIAATALDQVLPDPTVVQKTCLSYLPTDTALFWTDEADRILLKKQRQYFEPLLRWLKRVFDIELQVSKGGEIIGKLNHPQSAKDNAQRIIQSMDHLSLACLQTVTMECKSLVMALAYLGRYITVDQCIAASRVEEEFQVEIWGVVEGGHDMDRLNNAVSISAAGLFFGLVHDTAAHAKLMEKWSAKSN